MICNICGTSDFSSGPGGRLSRTGLAPYCKNCGSLERHRALRNIYTKLFGPLKNKFKNALQISDDLVVPRTHFEVYEVSIYGKENSIDLMNIDRANEWYDWIVCNHVLEHVEDDRVALKELFRILKNDGILQISVPNPALLRHTIDWGYADLNRHGHYREYGREDFLAKFREQIHAMHVLAYVTTCTDPVTAEEEYAYFFSKNPATMSSITDILRS